MRARDLLLTGLAAIMAYASPVPARQAPKLARDGSPMLFDGARLIVGDAAPPLNGQPFSSKAEDSVVVGKGEIREGEEPLTPGWQRFRPPAYTRTRSSRPAC